MKFAKVISVIFQPLSMTFIGVLYALYYDPYLSVLLEARTKMYLLAIVFANTFFFPSLIVLYLVKKGVLSGLQIAGKKERLLPFAFALLFYVVTYVMIRNTGLPVFLKSLLLVTLLNMLISGVITIFWKISLHMTGIGGLTGAVMGLSLLNGYEAIGVWSLLILLSGMIASSRLRLGVHTPKQLVLGYVISWLSGLVIVCNGWVL